MCFDFGIHLEYLEPLRRKQSLRQDSTLIGYIERQRFKTVCHERDSSRGYDRHMIG